MPEIGQKGANAKYKDLTAVPLQHWEGNRGQMQNVKIWWGKHGAIFAIRQPPHQGKEDFQSCLEFMG